MSVSPWALRTVFLLLAGLAGMDRGLPWGPVFGLGVMGTFLVFIELLGRSIR